MMEGYSLLKRTIREATNQQRAVWEEIVQKGIVWKENVWVGLVRGELSR